MTHPTAGLEIRQRFDNQLQANGIPQVCLLAFPLRPLAAGSPFPAGLNCASTSTFADQGQATCCLGPSFLTVLGVCLQEEWEAEWRRELGSFADSSTYLSGE